MPSIGATSAHAILAQNNRQRTSETWQRHQPEAVLLGLFYTADDEKYQPAFTKKPNGKRYRHYVPNRKVRFGADASPAGRVPAEPIEQMVLAQIHAAPMSPEMVQSVWDVVRDKYPALTEPEMVLPLRQMGQVWARLTPNHRPETCMKSRGRASTSHRSNGEKRGVRGPVGRKMRRRVDDETPDPAESPANTGAAGGKKPNR